MDERAEETRELDELAREDEDDAREWFWTAYVLADPPMLESEER